MDGRSVVVGLWTMGFGRWLYLNLLPSMVDGLKRTDRAPHPATLTLPISSQLPLRFSLPLHAPLHALHEVLFTTGLDAGMPTVPQLARALGDVERDHAIQPHCGEQHGEQPEDAEHGHAESPRP